MAKRNTIGSVCKGKTDEETGVTKPDYIKIGQDVTLKKGDFVRLESKNDQIASINKAAESGKLDADFAQTLLERANKIPDFVRFELVQLKD